MIVPTGRASLRAMGIFLAFGLLQMVNCLTALAQAADAQMQSSYVKAITTFYDPNGSAPLSELAKAEWKPLEGVLSRGFTKGTCWVRLELLPHSEPLVLRTRPAFLDSVEIYKLDSELAAQGTGTDPSLILVAQLGDQNLPAEAPHLLKLNGVFDIPASSEPSTFFVRLRSQSSHLLLIDVQTSFEAASFEQAQGLLLGGYIGFLLTFAIWALAQLYLSFDKVIATFLVKQVADLAYVSGFTGLMGVVFTAFGIGTWTDRGFSVAVLFVVSAGSWFHARLLEEFKPHPFLHKLLWSGVAVFPLGLLLFAIGQTQTALFTNTVVANVFPLIALLCALTTTAYKEPKGEAPSISKFQLVLTYTVFAVSLQVATLPALGVWAGQELALNAFLIHGLFTSLLLLGLLMTRAKQHESIRLEARAKMSLMEQEVRILSERRQEQGRFMAMLVHELKTPLSVIRLVLGGSGIETKLREAAGRAVKSMSDVIERCRQAEIVEDLDLRTSKFESVDLNRLAIELIDERDMARRTKLDTRFPVTVRSDPTLVKVVLSNLLDNANRYSPAGSPVTLRLTPEVQQGIKGVRIVVNNLANPGSLPDADRVFDKYYRHASAQRDTGSGLGLFLVRELSERLGGWVLYTPPSPDDPTLSFAVWLPVSAPRQEST